MSASLGNIHQTLQDLEDLRARMLEEGADPEAFAAVDSAISEWLDQSPEKVTAYVEALLETDQIEEACDKRIEYFKAIKKAAIDKRTRMKANALAVMQRFDVKELKATPGGGLRRVGNGSVQPLEIPEILDLPAEYRLVSMKVPAPLVQLMMDAAATAGSMADRIMVTIKPQSADTQEIREALKQRVVCQQCAAHPGWATPKQDRFCEACHGDRTIPASIPGAKLLPRGERVEIFPKAKKELADAESKA